MLNNNSLLSHWIIVFSIAVIILGVYIYSDINIKAFFGVHNINRNLIYYSLIVVIVVLVVYIYALYYEIEIFKVFFSQIECSNDPLPLPRPENVSLEIRVKLGTLMHLQCYTGPIENGFDVTSSRDFFEMLFQKSGKLDFTQINGTHVYTIKVNNTVNTVNPDIIKQGYDLYGLP